MPPLDPSIHGLRTHAKKPGSFLHRQRNLFSQTLHHNHLNQPAYRNQDSEHICSNVQQ